MAEIIYEDPRGPIELHIKEHDETWEYYAAAKTTLFGSDDTLGVLINDTSIATVTIQINAPDNYTVQGTQPTSGWSPSTFAKTIAYEINVEHNMDQTFTCRLQDPSGTIIPVDPKFRLKKTTG